MTYSSLHTLGVALRDIESTSTLHGAPLLRLKSRGSDNDDTESALHVPAIEKVHVAVLHPFTIKTKS